MTLERVTKNVRCNGRQSCDLAVNVVISKKHQRGRERDRENEFVFRAQIKIDHVQFCVVYFSI